MKKGVPLSNTGTNNIEKPISVFSDKTNSQPSSHNSIPNKKLNNDDKSHNSKLSYNHQTSQNEDAGKKRQLRCLLLSVLLIAASKPYKIKCDR